MSRKKHQTLERGGAAIEYIIVSVFSALLSVAVITWATKFFKEQLEKVSAKSGAVIDIAWPGVN